MTTWYTGTVGICFLMTTRTIQSGHSFAFWTSNDIGEMTVAIIAPAEGSSLPYGNLCSERS